MDGTQVVALRVSVALSMLGAFIAIPAHAAPQCPAEIDRPDAPGLRLEGSMNGAPVRAYLRRVDADTRAVEGVVVYMQTWSPDVMQAQASARMLTGTLSDDCTLSLKEQQREDQTAAVWTLDAAATKRFEGTWESSTTTARAGRISLNTVGSFDCGEVGSWQRFAAPDWPITFEYPRLWRLARSEEDSMTLECPDPERLLSGGGEITLTKGTGPGQEIALDDGRRVREIEGFLRLPNATWLYGGNSCEDSTTSVSCGPARQATRRGMTVLQATFGEDRRYSPAGYVGQGPGRIHYLFLLGGVWVALESAEAPPWLDQLEGPGSVVFSSEGVTGRLVLSITPVAAKRSP